MNTQLFYFSGTGNSLRVAKDLAANLGDTEVLSIPKALNNPIPPTAPRIGIVFPVYAWGPPLIVARFCRQTGFPAGAYIFAVATCGGMACGALSLLEGILKKRGITLALGAVVKMPGNYTPMYGAQSQETQNKHFACEKHRVAEIARRIAAGRTGDIQRGTWLGRILLSGIVYQGGMSQFPKGDRKFRTNAACDGCGLCAKVCPVDNITLTDNRPVWRHHCEQCMACLQWCPREAIQVGRVTEGRKRYHHPDFTAADFM